MNEFHVTLAKLLDNEPVKDLFVDVDGEDPAFVPIAKKSVAYIVAAVIYDSEHRVLLKQEAKKEHALRWYLPAGKVKPGESIEEAVRREVLEDTGLKFTPRSLLTVECCAGQWYRFTFTGDITGGKLKKGLYSVDDKQSLQAKYFSLNEIRTQKVLRLRADDLGPLLNSAEAHRLKILQHPNMLTIQRFHTNLYYRMVLFRETDWSYELLINESEEAHLPTAVLNVTDMWSTLAVYRLLKEAFGRDDLKTHPLGVLTVEYTGNTRGSNVHGLCLTCVSLLEAHPPPTMGRYTWYHVPDRLGEALHARLQRDRLVPFFDLF